jgi:RimJ/RimL family protein N-acetyltransferase|tara:strand:- start:1410 stop:2036 length:627 start_codon:yes stop_codon:yes gene_type:complete
MKFNFNNDYYLENDFVILEPLQESHFDHLLKFSLNEPELWTYSLVKADSELNLRNYLNLALKGKENQKEYPFIVYDKINKCYAGSTRFYDIQIENSSIQLGYTWYGKQFQKTGLNRHCKFLLLEFAFKILEAERIEFRADNENKKSIDAMKSIGCTIEGVLRSNCPKHDGTRKDSILLSIIKNEWKRKIREDLKEKCKPLKAFMETSY